MTAAAGDIWTIDRAALDAPVRRLLGASARVVEWRRERMSGGIAPTSAGLQRVAGLASVDGRSSPWSLVVKLVKNTSDWAPGAEPERTWGYWRREVLAYGSGFLARLPGGVRAPRCYGVDESEAGARLWLEDVVDTGAWSAERFARVARQLGVLNGAYLARGAVPDEPWLSRGGLRSWCEMRAPRLGPLATVQDDPALAPYWPTDVVEGTRRLVAERGAFFDALDRLPQSFCHCDATGPNLLVDAEGATVAVDWAFAGQGAVGQELAQLLVGSAVFFCVEVERLPELTELCLDAHLAGLAEAGWRGAPRLARLGFLIDAATRHGIFEAFVTPPSEELRARILNASGHSAEESMARMRDVRHLTLSWADEARQLMPAPG